MSFKNRLKKLRGDRGLTQDQLADKVGIPASTIRRYESSDEVMIQKDRLELFADFFHCSIDYLLGRTENPNTVLTEPDRVVLDALDIGNDEVLKKVSLILDGVELTEEQIRDFLTYVRVDRAKNKY